MREVSDAHNAVVRLTQMEAYTEEYATLSSGGNASLSYSHNTTTNFSLIR